MNSNVRRIYDATQDQIVKNWCSILLANRDYTIWHTVFTKKDGTVRSMKFDISKTWTEHEGTTLTESGVTRVETAIKHNNLIVIELATFEDGTSVRQCRTVPLERLISLTPMW